MMERKLTGFLLIALFCSILSISIINTSAVYNISEGNSFVYQINKNEWSIQIGENSAQGSGVSLENNLFSEGTILTLEVNSVDFLGVDYEITNGTLLESFFTSEFSFTVDLSTYRFYPLAILDEFESKWNQLAIENGPPLLNVFVLAACSDTWGFFEELVNNTELQNIQSQEGFEEIEVINTDFQRTGEIVIYDFYIQGTVTDSGSIQAELTHNLKMVWSESIGHLLGYRLESSLQGISNSKEIDITFTSEIEVDGYSLPKFKYGIAFIPGFNLEIAFVTLVVFSFSTILCNKSLKRRLD